MTDVKPKAGIQIDLRWQKHVWRWLQEFSRAASAGGSMGQVTRPSKKAIKMAPPAETMTLSSVDAYFNLALLSLIIGCAITVCAGIAVIWLSGIKARYDDQQVASALAQSDKAKAEVARANERTAQLLVEARQALLEQERLRGQNDQVRAIRADRRISPDQRTKIITALAGQTTTIVVLSSNGDPEAHQFAEDVTKTMREAGLTVNATTSVVPIPIQGLGLSMSRTGAATQIYAALRSAGFELKDLPERDPVMIVVGAKPAS